MVSVRRPVRDKGRGGGVGGGTSMLTIRNIIMLIIVLQSLNLLIRLYNRKGAVPSPSTQNQNLEDILSDSKAKVFKNPDTSTHSKPQTVRIGKEQTRPKLQPPPLRDPMLDNGKSSPEAPDDLEPMEKQPQPKQDVDQNRNKGNAQLDEEGTWRKEPVQQNNAGTVADAAGPGHVDSDEKQQNIQEVVVEIEDGINGGGNSNNIQVQQTLAKHGTGPTVLGYVVDLVRDREVEPFRSGPIPNDTSHYQPNAHQVAQQVLGSNLSGSSTVTSCEYIHNGRVMERPVCSDPETPLIVYNNASFVRNLCGTKIEPHQAVRIDEPCNEPVHLLVGPAELVPIDGKGMPPVIIYTNDYSNDKSAADKAKLTSVECNIPCQWEAGGEDPLALGGGVRYVAGTEWKVSQYMDDPAFVLNARVERTDFKRDVYYSTTSFSSSVPLSHYSFEKYNLRKAPALDFDKVAPAVSYVVNNDCQGGTARRSKWFNAVNAAMKTQSYGQCSNNAKLEPGETVDTLEGRIALMKKNSIVLGFELNQEKDHITPNVWEALMSGAVPALLGAPNLEQHLPPNAAIYTTVFNSWDRFASFLKEVAANKTKWQSYHKWRTDEKALAAFERRYNFTRTPPQCRMCRWAYAKKFGLGWDHEQQQVMKPKIDRQLCLDEASNLISRPFREVWVQPGTLETEVEKEVCTAHPQKEEATIEMDGYIVTRSIAVHDGIIDMTMNKIEGGAPEDLVLRLKIPSVRNYEGAYYRNVHTLLPTSRGPLVTSAAIQDEEKKVTVLANWATKIYSPEEGVIDLVVHQAGETIAAEQAPKRIRVITEDMSELHDKLTEFYPSSFSKLMITDFIDPLEYYYLGSV